MEFRILGRTQVVTDGGEVALGGSQRRSLLAVLLVDAGVVVPAERLVEALWPVGPPMSAAQTVQSHVSQLRKLLGADRIETVSGGYRLVVDDAEVDAAVFEREFELGRVAVGSGGAAGAVTVLDTALGRWRGLAFEDADGCERAVAESARLEGLRTSALELLLDARLALGQHDRVAADAEAAVAQWPLRERLWASLMAALYRCGRHADALSAYQRLRSILAEQLGLDPSPSLVELEARILRHDPSLLLPSRDATPEIGAPPDDVDPVGVPVEAAGHPTTPTTMERGASMGALPTGTVTFVFTDIEGSTRRWEDDPDGMRGALVRHDELVRAAVEAHRGHVVKTTGDGVLAAFARAPHAVLAAVEAQRSLAAEPWVTEEALRVRMGLHTGEVELVDGDYHGPPLNRAARIMSVAQGGQILLSQVTHRLSQEALAEGIESVDLGEHRLRDLSRPERIFQLVGEGLSSQIGGSQRTGNLPGRSTSFIGRERETRRVCDALTAAPLVTLTGVGGVGKTRLAVHVAEELAPTFEDGVWLCELAAVDSPEALLQVVAATLGVQNRAGVDLTEALVDFLRAKQLLLVLDNCEHLLTTAGDLAEVLLASCRGLRVLATSREGLAVEGEQVMPLRSLDLPPVEAEPPVMAAAAAVRLFVERAAAAGADLSLEGDDLVAVAEICRRLDGVPLALELAAARAAAMSPADIAVHLDERFRLLTGGRRNAVERHQTLRAAVDWSYGSLIERDRAVFDRLGVFAGGFDLAAAQGVVAADGVNGFDAVDALTSLVAKSMVVADHPVGGAARYRLLETMRQYARDRLDESGAADVWRRRHATYFVDLAEQAAPGFQGPDEIMWRARISEDLDNLRAAVNWALDREDASDAQLGIRIIVSLVIEGIMRRSSGIGTWTLRALDRRDELSPAHLYDLRTGAAWDLFQSGDVPAAHEIARVAVAEGVPAGVRYTAGPFVALASSSALLGDLDTARSAYRSGREASEGTKDETFSLAVLLSAEAMTLAGAGETTEARPCAEEALQLARKVRNPTVLVLANFALGWALMNEDPASSRSALEECIALSNAGAMDGSVGGALARVARLRLRDGEPVGAIDALLTGLARVREVGDRTSLASVIDASAIILDDLGAVPAAVLAHLLVERTGMPSVHAEIEPGRREAMLARLRSNDSLLVEAAARRADQLSNDEVLDLLVEELTRLRTTIATAREPELPVP